VTTTGAGSGAPGLRLGAPGIYRSPQVIEATYQPVRLDVAGFVGVALRGPVNECTLVRSWSDYERIFGGYERPGDGPDRILPYAVAAFFGQGGVRAYVVRVTPPGGGTAPGDGDTATARYQLGDVMLAAANEGSWGNALTIELGYVAAQTFLAVVRPTDDGGGKLALPGGLDLPAGSLLRVRGPGLDDVGEFRWVTAVGADRAGRPVATLDAPVGAAAVSVTAAVVTATVDVADGDPAFARHESISGLGLHPAHPRFLGRTVNGESELVRVTGVPPGALTPSGPLLLPVPAVITWHGADQWQDITGASFFDDDPSDADPLDERPHRGVDLIGRQAELGIVCVPDLLWR
jgi:Bacteriophage tail sheath protein